MSTNSKTFEAIFSKVSSHFKNRPQEFLNSYLRRNISVEDIVYAVMGKEHDKLNEYGTAQWRAIVDYNLS